MLSLSETQKAEWNLGAPFTWKRGLLILMGLQADPLLLFKAAPRSGASPKAAFLPAEHPPLDRV